MKGRYITQENIDYLKQEVYEVGGIVYIIPGCLKDNYIMVAPSQFKSMVIKEHYLNEWSSENLCIMYKKLPKKYEKVIELLKEDKEEQAYNQFWLA